MHAQALSGMDSCLRDRSLFIAWGGGGGGGGGRGGRRGGFGAKQGEI